MVNGIRNSIKKITSLKNGQELTYRFDGHSPPEPIAGFCWIDVPKEARDEVCTVIKLEFDEPLDPMDMNVMDGEFKRGN